MRYNVVTWLLALVIVLALAVPPMQAQGAGPGLLPDDAQSTTGPVPPPGIERGNVAPTPSRAQVVLHDVPAYLWRHGCAPTAAGMVMGYWDGRGFDALVSGSAATQTSAVNAMIASSGNYNDYCLPLDEPPTMLPDRSEPPAGDEHPDDCVADLMKTSQSAYNNYYGWSYFNVIDDAMSGYPAMVAPQYSVTTQNRVWGDFTWTSYRAEIDAGRPVVLLVDTDADGTTDHFVTGIGYDTSTNQYACRDTWDTGVHWFSFAQLAPGQPWGIYGATLFRIEGPSSKYRVFLPLISRTDSTSSGWTIIKSETFEGSFPNAWEVGDNNGTDYGEYVWQRRSCLPYAGSFSGWAIGGGASGSALGCGSQYPNHADSWMIYGPFSLADASAADLSFKLWLNSEPDYDKLCRMASLNGTNFFGMCTTGNTSGWTDRVLDLANVYNLGNLMGQSQVWIALRFVSDDSVTYAEGAHVDNVVLRKSVGAGAAPIVPAGPADPATLHEEVASFTVER
ncbi:MAG: C39 family peptidase [Anaerolineae bacterium]|nr:C39 family peptidase [Anaerolineae bacterium]